MNELGSDVLRVMEDSSLGRMSVYILTKQTRDLGIDLERISEDEVLKLAERLHKVLPFFLSEETDDVVRSIRKLVNDGSMVRT